MNSNDRHPLYQAAIDADEAYSAAIISAYGLRATRWDLPATLCASVESAYRAKRDADWSWLNHMQATRQTVQS